MTEESNILSIVGSIWCRTLCVLERLEMVVDQCAKRTTLCHDIHTDKEKPTASQEDIESEYEVQSMALEKAWFPIKDQLGPFSDDLLAWAAGREELQLKKSRVDELVIKLLALIKGEKRSTPSPAPGGSEESKDAPNNIGGEVKLVVDSHSHARGDKSAGLKRLNRLFPNDSVLPSVEPSEPDSDKKKKIEREKD
jgi:hypothetical protein